jgi:two-component system LytT family response regulator
MSNIKTIIIDDEINAIAALRGILEENFKEIEILDEANLLTEAVKKIRLHQPDVIFLDIEMPGFSGLKILEFFNKAEITFKIIFVTAYSEFALNAFEMSAIDYLHKPVNLSSLQRAIEKIHQYQPEQLDIFESWINQAYHPDKKIVLQTGEGLVFIKLSEIIYLKAEISYTEFILVDKKRILTSKKIIDYEKITTMGPFQRIHRSHIINLTKINKIIKSDGGYVVMDDGSELSISSEKKEQLIQSINQIKL